MALKIKTQGLIRRALPHEAEQLSTLALRSKAHWGYDQAFLEACRAVLTLKPEFLLSAFVFVIEDAQTSEIAGFYSLQKLNENTVELKHLFIEPHQIGQGYGKLLWQHAVNRAESTGFRELVIESDPFAEAFYLRMGASRTGAAPSSVLKGRMLPVLRYTLD